MINDIKFRDWCYECGIYHVEGDKLQLVRSPEETRVPPYIYLDEITDDEVVALFTPAVNRFARLFDRLCPVEVGPHKLRKSVVLNGDHRYPELTRLAAALAANGYRPDLATLKPLAAMLDVQQNLSARNAEAYHKIAGKHVEEMFDGLGMLARAGGYDKVVALAQQIKYENNDESAVTLADINTTIDQVLAMRRAREQQIAPKGC